MGVKRALLTCCQRRSMAFNGSITTRLGDLRYRNSQTSTGESQSGYTTPSRYSGSFMNSHSQSASDARASLQRRFTTDSSKMQPLAPMSQQAPHMAEQVEVTVSPDLFRLYPHLGFLSEFRRKMANLFALGAS